MKTVCGQTHPQKSLPNTTVKRTMKMMKVIMAIAKMKKSWGQNILLNKINLPAGRLIIINGILFTLMKGNTKNTVRYA